MFFPNIEQEITVMSKDHSRRAILAGITAAPALALALCGSDPIFASDRAPQGNRCCGEAFFLALAPALIGADGDSLNRTFSIIVHAW
jgi:hypothetical protein